jgi:hypothetical protein
MQLTVTIFLLLFVGLCWAQAPGDEDDRCTVNHSNPPQYPDTVRNLMDSYNYENLLPGNGTGNSPIATAVWNDFSFDGNDVTPETLSPTYWQQGAGGICRFQTRVCGWKQNGVIVSQNNWLFTQHISSDFDSNIYNYDVAIHVEAIYSLQSCRLRQGCIQSFNLLHYMTNSQQLPSTSGNGYINTQNYENFAVPEGPVSSVTYTNTYNFTLPPSSTGFYIAVQDIGSCIALSRLRVYRNNCKSRQVGLVLYPDAPAPVTDSEKFNNDVSCVENAVVSGSRVLCRSNGTWGSQNPVCQCKCGYEPNREEATRCNACPAGQWSNDTVCLQCPANTKTTPGVACSCSCKDGYFRNNDEGFTYGCTKPPSAPSGVLLSATNTTERQSVLLVELVSIVPVRILPASHVLPTLRRIKRLPLNVSVSMASSETTPPAITIARHLITTAQSLRVLQKISINITWSDPADLGERTDLYYQAEISDPDNLGSYTGTLFLRGSTTSRTISSLRPHTQYCVRVTSHNGVSDQDPDREHLRTVEECTTTLEALPGMVSGVQGTYPYVVWNPPEEPNGVITGYRLTFTCSGSTNTINTMNDQTFYVIQQSDSPCSTGSVTITVSAVNSAGAGPSSEPFNLPIRLRCPELQSPADGTVTYDSLDAGSQAVYMCSQGFMLVGCDSVRTCGSDGAWSGQPPLCNSEVCTVELVGDIEVDGTSATFVILGVGSGITRYTCKLDGTVLPNCSSPLTGVRPGAHRLRVVPKGCQTNKGATFRFQV